MTRANLQAPFLKGLSIVGERVSNGDYPFNLDILKQRNLSLTFTNPVTFLVGDNGTGKSTLLEAIAQHCGFNVGGGSRDHSYVTDAAATPLADALRFAWLPKVSNGIFLRAESYFNFASYIESIRREWPADIAATYGAQPLHEQSHGQSFLALFENRFGTDRRAIYLLDEPEAALSPKRQLQFLSLLHRWARSGNAQFIIATHSPIIMSYPGATLLSFDGDAIHEIGFRATEHYQVTRSFLIDPEGHFDALFADQPPQAR